MTDTLENSFENRENQVSYLIFLLFVTDKISKIGLNCANILN